MRDIEQSGSLPYGAMLFKNALVFDGHIPAPEIDHLGPTGAMDVMERRFE